MRVITMTANVVCVIAAVIIAGYIAMLAMGIRPAVVVSGSMEPAVKTGSLIFIDTGYENQKAGDIAAFRTGGTLVTHRLVEDTDEGWITKGDANEDEDPWRVSDERIIGRAVFWIPVLGYIIGKGGGVWP